MTFNEDTALLTAKEVALIFELTVNTFFRATKDGRAPQPIMIGKTRRWKKSTVLNWIRDQDRKVNS